MTTRKNASKLLDLLGNGCKDLDSTFARGGFLLKIEVFLDSS